MNTEKTIIEINGVKLEVDLRTARRVDEMRVGTRVKVLKKKYSDTHEVFHGVIIGFEPFKQLPTIIVAYMSIEYNAAKIEYLYFNASTKETELVVATDDDTGALDKVNIVSIMDREVEKKRQEIAEIEARKSFFLSKFAMYWSAVEAAVKDATS